MTCIVVHYTVKIGQEENNHEVKSRKVSPSDIGGVQVDSHRSSTASLMQSFGQKNKEILATDNKYWRAACNVTNTHALSAINRVKTEKCRKEISSISCLTGDNVLHPDFIQKYKSQKLFADLFISKWKVFSLCDRFEEDRGLVLRGGKILGCYEDRPRSRLLGGFVRTGWAENSPGACVTMCSRNVNTEI